MPTIIWIGEIQPLQSNINLEAQSRYAEVLTGGRMLQTSLNESHR